MADIPDPLNAIPTAIRLPLHVDREPSEWVVAGGQRGTFDDRLSGQHAIERVAMGLVEVPGGQVVLDAGASTP